MSIEHVVGAWSDVADGEAKRVVVDGRAIALVRIDDDIYALDDICSHAEVSLSDGFVEADDCAIECPRHGAQFDLRTGEPLTLPAVRPVDAFDVAVVDGNVVITITESEEQS